MRERRQRPRAAEAAAVTARRAPSTHAHCFPPLLLYPRGPPFAERPAHLPGLSLPALRMCCRRGSVSLHFVSISFPHLPCVASSGEEAAAAAAAGAGAGRAFPFGPGLPEVAAAALASPCPRPLSAQLPALLPLPSCGMLGEPLGKPLARRLRAGHLPSLSVETAVRWVPAVAARSVSSPALLAFDRRERKLLSDKCSGLRQI